MTKVFRQTISMVVALLALVALMLGSSAIANATPGPVSSGPQPAVNSAPASAAVVCGASGAWSSSRSYAYAASTGWCTIDGNQKIIYQSDGNLVYHKGSSAVWSSGTYGHPGSVLRFQTDGNMVIYQGTTAIWNARTGGTCSGSFSAGLYYFNFGGGNEYLSFNVNGCRSVTIASAPLN